MAEATGEIGSSIEPGSLQELNEANIPIRIDTTQELTEPDESTSPFQREMHDINKRYREIIHEAGAEPNRGGPYIDAALAAMGYERTLQPDVDEKIKIQLKYPGYNFGGSLSPEKPEIAYIRKLQPIPPKK